MNPLMYALLLNKEGNFTPASLWGLTANYPYIWDLHLTFHRDNPTVTQRTKKAINGIKRENEI